MSGPLADAARRLGCDPSDLGVDEAGRRAELAQKLARVGEWLAARESDALWLRRPENLAWIAGGGDLLVNREGPPVAEAIVTGDGLTVVTSRIEAARLAAEELPPGTQVETVAWHDPGARGRRVAGLLQGRAWCEDADADLTALRQPLLAVEQARLAAVAAVAGRTLTDAAVTLSPDLSEREVAAVLHGSLRRAGVDVPVALVAGAERFGHVRHPVPTEAPLGHVGLLVVCAKRFGLVASCSRIVAFGEAPESTLAALRRVWRVEAAMLDATRPGVATGDVLAAARRAYAGVEEANAWEDHHQGGPAGYLPREWLATPDEGRPLAVGMAVAWNPSLPWAKSEDTFLIGPDALRDLTRDERWPSEHVAGRPRPTVLVP